ncbi:hypothetical protein MUK42_34873 [Musa troglodytarum]|uniref:Uncharacterized protein n=1 Tax=Musa troglodytarum TaxID=320322 RepID=A0A9E7EHK8_9LILI|nr:hypothetical protein MUK42_34873 [Musa troglodytarum]
MGWTETACNTGVKAPIGRRHLSRCLPLHHVMQDSGHESICALRAAEHERRSERHRVRRWLCKKAAFSFLNPLLMVIMRLATEAGGHSSKRPPLRVFLCAVDDGLAMGYWQIVVVAVLVLLPADAGSKSLHIVCLGAICSRDPTGKCLPDDRYSNH